jgi:hypothetical protein
MVLLIINKLFKKFPRLLRLLLNKLSNENRDRKANTAVKRPGVYSSALKVLKKNVPMEQLHIVQIVSNCVQIGQSAYSVLKRPYADWPVWTQMRFPDLATQDV